MRVKVTKQFAGYEAGIVYNVSRDVAKALLSAGVAEATGALAADEQFVAAAAEVKKQPQTVIALADFSQMVRSIAAEEEE